MFNLLTLLLSVSQPAVETDADRWQTFLEEYHKQKIATTERRMEEKEQFIRDERRKPKKIRADLKSMRQLINKMKRQVSQLNNQLRRKEFEIPKLRVDPGSRMTVGLKGVLDDRVIVQDVVNNDEMLVFTEGYTAVIPTPFGGGGSRGGNRYTTDPILVKGLPTARRTTGNEFRLKGVFEITGTRTYKTTLGGQRTVLVYESMDIDLDLDVDRK